MKEKMLAMRIANEKGIALVLSLFLMMIMSIVGASLMFLSQTETYSSMNYRLMSQARYGAEAGVQTAAHYLMYSYTAPTAAEIATSYNPGVSPVTCKSGCPVIGMPVILSANSAVASNYPVAAAQTAFSAAVQGSLAAGTTTVNYQPYATLLSMQQISVYGGGIQTIQTWQITSDGSITVGRTAQVEVTAVLETQPTPAQMYAAFATSGACGALTFAGSKSTNTDSYNSSATFGVGQTTPTISLSGGNVGTNGNLTESGGSTINGTLSSPRVGVGGCSSGNVDALSSSGGATVTGGVIELPQAASLAPPAAPNPLPPTTAFSGDNLTLPSLLNPGPFGDITVSNNKTLTLGALNMTSYITVNSLTMSGNANLVILGTVILNVAGQSQTTPITFAGNATSGNAGNAAFNPANFQIQYAGTGAIKVTGSSELTAMIYAPNAAAQFSGGADYYGSIITSTLTDTGGATIHYDSSLSKEFFAAGNPMMSSFSWKKSK
jgi:Tfp pilus assembly protein PilX